MDYRDKRLSPETMRSLIATWTANLQQGLGETGSERHSPARGPVQRPRSPPRALDNAAPSLDEASPRRALRDARLP